MDYAKIRAFYSQLEDEESRYIFERRIKYLFTGDRKHLYEMTENVNRLFHPVKIVRNVRHLLNHAEDYPSGAIIYSAGTMPSHCLEQIQRKNIKVQAFCDLYYQRWQSGGYLGLPVISPNELVSNAEYKKCAIIMSNEIWQKINSDFLIANGFSVDFIFVLEWQYNFTNYAYRGSYFEQDFLVPADNEVYIDAGCYNGDTIKRFNDFCFGNYNRIIGFEPHPVNYQQTMENVKKWGLHDTEIIQKGVWSSDGEYSFILEYGTGAEGARIMDTGDTMAQTTTIDKVIGDERVTFIKMDVEGAELEALKGAKNTILRNNPKLAICIYHKPEDIIEIPLFIYDLAPDYKFYIRHHNYIQDAGNIALDTVLYAL